MIIKKRSEVLKEVEKPEMKPQPKEQVQEKVDLFDLDNIDFAQRQERRRGDRRRGYRRIDDRNLISRAQEEAGMIKDSAAKEGYEAGLELAKREIGQVQETFKTFLAAPKEVFEYIAPDILEISVDIAKKIVKKEIEQDPQIVLDVVLDALKATVRNETKITIFVNPAQVSLIKENIPQIVSSAGTEAKINVFSDDTIEVGGCVLKTSNGIIDATINTQIEIIKESLKGM